MERLITYYDQPYCVIELPERYLDLIPDELCIKIGVDDENRPYKILLGNRKELDFINIYNILIKDYLRIEVHNHIVISCNKMN